MEPTSSCNNSFQPFEIEWSGDAEANCFSDKLKSLKRRIMHCQYQSTELWKGDGVIMRSGTVDGFNANGINLRPLTVELLTGETILLSTEAKTTCSAVWNRVEGELVARGVVHPQIFGLAIKTGSDWVFVDPDAKVSKYFPKEWKSALGSTIHENKSLVLYCRVHFYLDALPQNFDVVSLHHYYLQLRQNVVTARRVSTNLIQPLAYALQGELGDWSPCQEAPRWTEGLTLLSGAPVASAQASLRRAHQGLAGLGQDAARAAFIRALIPTYNMHIYGMTLRIKDGKEAPAWIGVTPKGIEVYQNGVGRNEIPEQPKITFLWAKITKLYFERKKFEIRGRAACGGTSTEKLSFNGATESVSRHLLLLCRSTHQFHLSNHKVLMPNSSSDYGTQKMSSSTTTMSSTGESHSSRNDDKMLDLSLWPDGLFSEHQRVSVISSSSGIVSDPDRVYSLDGSEEDFRTHHSTANSTSLESLSHKQRHGRNLENQTEEDERREWYCDSDCEDCEDSGHCRSVLVRTIAAREKHFCSGNNCKCNSCVVEEDEFERFELGSNYDDSTNIEPIHQNTLSMASEKTLTGSVNNVEPAFNGERQVNDQVQKKKPEQKEDIKHIYGEMLEVPKTESDGEYCTIDKQNSTHDKERAPGKLPPKPKPRLCNPENRPEGSNKAEPQVSRNNQNPNCCGKHKPTASKSRESLTPKVASLKCLRPKRNSTSTEDEPDGCYNGINKRLTQGRYPSTRTVSDNFETDADYVQLPPLMTRPPPKRPTQNKLWKFVKNHHKSCGNVNEVGSSRTPPPIPPHIRKNNMRTLPRPSQSISESFSRLAITKQTSRSTMALNTIASDEPPEPPPKPRKLTPGAELMLTSKPVDARFITTKPQILVQKATYATQAPMAIPSQAQILYRGSNIPPRMRSHSHIVTSIPLQHSQSVENIYDTVSNEESVAAMPIRIRKQLPPPPLYPKSSTPVIIRPNNYIDVQATRHSQLLDAGQHKTTTAVSSSVKNRGASGSVQSFLADLQNLNERSRAPIVHPHPATGCNTLTNGGGAAVQNGGSGSLHHHQQQHHNSLPYPYSRSVIAVQSSNPNMVHTPHAASGSTASRYPVAKAIPTRASQIQQFKAQLYSDIDYVHFPPKDPRASIQEYLDARSLSLTTVPANSNSMLSNNACSSLSDIPPPYMPPPYGYATGTGASTSQGSGHPVNKINKPPRPLPNSQHHNLSSTSMAPSYSQPPQNSYVYNPAMSSNNSQCSSHGYYAINGNGSAAGLNAENLQRFASAQSLSDNNHTHLSSPPPIYYAASTHSAPPLPRNHNQILIENGMRKAVQKIISNLSPSDERIRLKLLSRSEESLYSQPHETEERLQAIYNLPPPPPYSVNSPSVDLATLRAKISSMELPLLKALCSDGALMTQTRGKPKPQPQPQAPKPQLQIKPNPDPIELPVPPRPPKPAKLRQQSHLQNTP